MHLMNPLPCSHRPFLQVAETAVTIFISGDRPNVAGLVLAGSADFKTELSQSDMFDQRLQAAVLAVVDVSYGAPLLGYHLPDLPAGQFTLLDVQPFAV